MASDTRIAVVFRSDLEMPRGKSEVQFGHAVSPLITPEYMESSQMKLSLEVPGVIDLMGLVETAKRRGVPYYVVVDAGRTVFTEPTITCVGFGPMDKTDSNSITRGAKLR